MAGWGGDADTVQFIMGRPARKRMRRTVTRPPMNEAAIVKSTRELNRQQSSGRHDAPGLAKDVEGAARTASSPRDADSRHVVAWHQHQDLSTTLDGSVSSTADYMPEYVCTNH